MKKRIAALLASLLLFTVGCGGTETEAPKPVTLDTLRVELAVPDGAGADFLAAASPWETLLKDALAQEGVTVRTLTLTYSRSSLATAEALASGSVDAAFLQAEQAAGAGESLAPLLALAGVGLAGGGAAAAWNAAGAKPAAGTAYGLLTAGSSAYGRELAERMESAGALTWNEWNHAAWGVTEDETLQQALALYLEENAAAPSLPENVTVYESAAALAAAAAAGEIDAALVRSTDRAADMALWADMPVLALTAPLYGTVAALSLASGTVSSAAVLNALMAALQNVAAGEGKSLLAFYGAIGTAAVSADDWSAYTRLAAKTA